MVIMILLNKYIYSTYGCLAGEWAHFPTDYYEAPSNVLGLLYYINCHNNQSVGQLPRKCPLQTCKSIIHENQLSSNAKLTV